MPDNPTAIAQAEQKVTQQSYFVLSWYHGKRYLPDGTPDPDTTQVCESYSAPISGGDGGTVDDVLAVGPGTYSGGPSFQCPAPAGDSGQ